MKANLHRNSTLTSLTLVFFMILAMGKAQAQTIYGDQTVDVGSEELYELSSPVSGANWGVPAAATILSSNNSSATVRWDSPGNYAVFEYTSGASLTVTVSGSSLPLQPSNPTIYPESESCGSATLQRAGNISDGAIWYWQGKTNNGTSKTKGSGSTYPISENTAGTYRYYIRAFKDGQWSSGSGYKDVTIYSTPSDPTAQDKSVCGSTVTLNASGSGSGVVYQWYQGQTAKGEGSSITIPSPSSTTTYKVRAKRGNCYSDFVDVRAVVLSVSPNNGKNSCSNPNSVTIGAYSGDFDEIENPGVKHKYYTAQTGGSFLGDGNEALGAAGFRTEFTVTQGGDYWVSVAYNGCESAREKVVATKTSNTTPTLDLSNILGDQCGSSVTFTLYASGGSTGSVYEWYEAQSGGNSVHEGSSFSPTVTTGEKTYYVGGVLKNSLGCSFPISPRQPIKVKVNPIPLEATGTDPVAKFCAGSFNLTATPGTHGTSVRWYNSASNGNELTPNPNGSLTTPVLSSTTSYYAESYNAATGCKSATRKEIRAVVNTGEISLSVPLEPVTNTCSSSNIVLYASSSFDSDDPNISHNWYTSLNGSQTVPSTQETNAAGYITKVTVTAQSKDYWVSAVYNGCESERKKISAMYQAGIAPTLDLSNILGDQCGSSVTFTLYASGGSTGSVYEWYEAQSGGNSVHEGSSFSPTVTTGEKTYYVGGVLKNSLGCSFPISPRQPIKVKVNPIPLEATGTDPVAKFCAGSFNLTATPGIHGTSVRWYNSASNGNELTPNPNGSLTTPVLSSSTSYYAESYNAATGCKSATRKEIRAVVNTGEISLSVPLDPVTNTCSSSDITLYANSNYSDSDPNISISHVWYTSAMGSSTVPHAQEVAAAYITKVVVPAGQSVDYWVEAIYNGCKSERKKISAVYDSNLNCGPSTCEANPIGNISLSALGESKTVTISFINSNDCSGSYTIGLPYESGAYDPYDDWLTITPDFGLTYTLSVNENITGNQNYTVLQLFGINADGTQTAINGASFTVSQATCLTEWYPDTDGDTLGDRFGASFVGCSAPDYGDGITWVPNNDDLCPETIGTVANQGCPDGQIPENFNTITTRAYDIGQNLKVASKRYFNELGRPIQSQSWNIRTNDVWASEVLYDSYERPALQSLSSPIRSGNSFSYKDGFIKQENSNNDYSTDDFTGSNSANPNPVGEQVNTLGWYYSENNSREEYQDVTDFPFMKTTYSDLMPGTPLRSMGGNKVDTDGSGAIDGNDSWTQRYTFAMRASEELSQADAFGDTQYNDIETIKTIIRDVHGVENVVFTDLDGKTLATALSGGVQSPISMTITIGDQGYVDVHVPQGVTGFDISGGDFSVHDLITEQSLDANQTANLPNGFYRVSVNTLWSYNPNLNPVTVSYKANYYDYSLNEYDEANRLKVTYQPIKDSSGNRLKTVYTYDNLNRLIKLESPETGTAEYIYRNDEKIRFSQNSKQAVNNEVSFTNYDYLGRPIKSGVWTNVTFANLNESSTVVVANTKEVLETIYDAVPETDNTLQGLSLAYQSPSFLSGNVARTKNDHTTTYYSYDIYGRVKWIVQDIVDLGLKTIDYTYDQVTGLVTEVDFQREVTSERFIHHYWFDDSSNQLTKVATSTNGNDKIVHAEYEYYENGTLKRKVLAGVQGVDYVYNLDGQLKAINHPGQNEENDPGKDGSIASGTQPDLFGMQIDYHNNDYNRSVDNIASMSYDENLFNGNIKAVRWNSGISPSGNTEQLYKYSYDRNDWLTDADYAIYNPDGDGNIVPTIEDVDVYNSGEVKNQVATESITLKPPFHAKSGSNYSAKIISAGSIQEVGDGDYDVTGIEYDANGNIKKLTRKKNTVNGENTMDDLTYEYYQGATNGTNTGTPNQLQRVADAVTRNTEADDIKGQGANNYQYNEIGELTTNTTEGISYIYNTVGLVTEVLKNNKTAVKFTYNDKWHRIRKERFSTDGVTLLETTYYVRNVQGMPLAVYSKTFGNTEKLIEHSIYGNSRIGVYQRYENASDISTYELTDHLGNVRAVFSKNASSTTNESFANYYPFGMDMPGPQNTLSANFYRYAFQGQEKDAETNKEAFELRLWDARIGRWLTTDPARQYSSPYIGMGNDPTNSIDPDGAFKWKWWAQSINFLIDGDGVRYNKKREEWYVVKVSGIQNSNSWLNDIAIEAFYSSPIVPYIGGDGGITQGAVGFKGKLLTGKVALDVAHDKENLLYFGLGTDDGLVAYNKFGDYRNNINHHDIQKSRTTEVSVAGIVGGEIVWDTSQKHEDRLLDSFGVIKGVGDRRSETLSLPIYGDITANKDKNGLTTTTRNWDIIGGSFDAYFGIHFNISVGYHLNYLNNQQGSHSNLKIN